MKNRLIAVLMALAIRADHFDRLRRFRGERQHRGGNH